MPSIAYFNSIKVRLERMTEQSEAETAQEFQFHKGAIRTLLRSRCSLRPSHFNSIKVRLERAL